MLRLLVSIAYLMLATSPVSAQRLQLASQGKTAYNIYLPLHPAPLETKAASVLQQYFRKVTSVAINVLPEEKAQPAGLYVGQTNLSRSIIPASTTPESFALKSTGASIALSGNGRGVLYAAYTFIEQFMGCRKWDSGPAYVVKNDTLSAPAQIDIHEQPAFVYREAYLPAAFDDEYLNWHRLHRFEEQWGMWGHTFFKLVPPEKYFKTHPEYFSLVNNERKPYQLCLSNKAVLNLTIDRVREEIKKYPDAIYWSISPNDDIGNCECADCTLRDKKDGGPTGTLIAFVNAVASKFPDKKFTTLAYVYSATPPAITRPASNVTVMLSSIDANRTLPLSSERTAAGFRANLSQWQKIGANLFVWDYATQFTNYLTPFPVFNNFKPNISFLSSHNVTGAFIQGSGDSFSDMHELNAYLVSQLLWNPAADADKLTKIFIDNYYGKAAPAVTQYLALLDTRLKAGKVDLDIYGNPVNNHADYLSPENLDGYSQLMDEAERAAAGDRLVQERVARIRLSQDYVVLQQAKFFGKEKHGIFTQDDAGNFFVKPTLPAKTKKFETASLAAGVKTLAEGGITPTQYRQDWMRILETKPVTNLAANAVVKLTYPFAPEYPSKAERTLTDETPGYEDFSYNWLCFYGVPMEAAVDMGSVKHVQSVTLRFLEDGRHWIFHPARVSLEVSDNGRDYRNIKTVDCAMPEESYQVDYLKVRFELTGSYRYIRVQALNWPSLPAWRYHKYKKPMIACDEILVE